MRELQGLIDALARRLQRAVAIDDPKLRLLAYTAHHEDVDDHRIHSIMKLRASRDVVDYANSFGIRAATAPMRVPRNPDLGLLERLCVPVWFHKTHLGYLWLIDDQDTLAEADIDEAVRIAGIAGEFLFRDQIVDGLRRAREKELFFDLVRDDASARELLSDDDLTAAGFGPSSMVRVMVVALADLEGDGDLEAVSLLLESVVARQLKVDPTISSVMGTRRSGECGIAIAIPRHADRADLFLDLGRTLREHALKALEGVAGTVRVGIGASTDDVREARHSYNQARSAIEVSSSIPRVDDVALWDDLGVYQFLEKVRGHEFEGVAIPQRLVALGVEGGEPLLETLEVYLDLAGNVQASARALKIHRATLYYRLNKIEAVTGMSLADGLNRLSLHLGVKMSHFQGPADVPPDA